MMGSPTVIELIERHTGIVVMAEHVERRLRPLASDRARALGLSSPSAYLDRLASEPVSGAEWGRVIMALTNGQTSFFRDPEQFDAIAEVLRARSRAAGGRPLAVWSAGCSTGEEPYSVAILAMELGIRAHVLGTDINTAFLDRARAACYGPWALRRVSEDRRTAWFDAIPGGFRVKAPVRAQVRLVRFNLARDRPPESPVTGGHWDVILCRNVFLYFNRQRMGDACRRLAMALAPSGRLFVAASETLHGLDLPLLPDIIGTRVAYRTAPAHGARPGVGPHVRPKITPVKGQDAAQSVGAAESARTARPSQTAGDSPTPRPSQTDGASRSPEAAGENGAAH
ncbi:MAG TPA: protein-glutamate O-methyltransferase CheR, partial [Kofleriaceae bacterium]|nr:protein-glutamate O-methyltransferase CheR [Kofleriaceae bacterium]